MLVKVDDAGAKGSPEEGDVQRDQGFQTAPEGRI